MRPYWIHFGHRFIRADAVLWYEKDEPPAPWYDRTRVTITLHLIGGEMLPVSGDEARYLESCLDSTWPPDAMPYGREK